MSHFHLIPHIKTSLSEEALQCTQCEVFYRHSHSSLHLLQHPIQWPGSQVYNFWKCTKCHKFTLARACLPDKYQDQKFETTLESYNDKLEFDTRLFFLLPPKNTVNSFSYYSKNWEFEARKCLNCAQCTKFYDYAVHLNPKSNRVIHKYCVECQNFIILLQGPHIKGYLNHCFHVQKFQSTLYGRWNFIQTIASYGIQGHVESRYPPFDIVQKDNYQICPQIITHDSGEDST